MPVLQDTACDFKWRCVLWALWFSFRRSYRRLKFLGFWKRMGQVSDSNTYLLGDYADYCSDCRAMEGIAG
jgi:hypothetical protein